MPKSQLGLGLVVLTISALWLSSCSEQHEPSEPSQAVEDQLSKPGAPADPVDKFPMIERVAAHVEAIAGTDHDYREWHSKPAGREHDTRHSLT